MPENLDQHIDLSIIDMLKEVMEEDFLMLLHTYISDSQVRLQELAQAESDHALEPLRRAAHCFKGSSANVGAERLSLLCQQLEQEIFQGDESNISMHLQLIYSEAEIVLTLLKQQYLTKN